MSIIGLYLGGDSISVAAVQKGALISSATHSISQGEGLAQEDSVFLEVQLNKLSREMNISRSDDLYVSLHDQDFIFRSFVIPCMSRKEIESSIEFEIEKYIPFKIEELIWNYSYERIVNEKKLIVSFIGYNKQVYKKITDTFPRLDLNLITLEPSSLSLLRIIRAVPQYKKLNWYVILDYGRHDCYITFFYGNLPVFSRTIFSSPADIPDKDKLIEEIRFSFQYFKREYRAYDLEKMIVVSEQELSEQIVALGEDLDIPVDILSPGQLIDNPRIDINSLKAYAAASYEKSVSFRPFLEETSTGFIYSKKGFAPPLNLILCVFVLVIGLIATIVSSLAINSGLSGLNSKLREKQDQFALKGSISAFDLSGLESSLNSKKSALALAEKKLDCFKDTKKILEKLISFAGEGLWFDKCNLKNDREKTEFQVSGYIYIGDREKERETLDSFISLIRKDEELKKVFTNPLFFNQERTTLKDFSVLRFTLKLS